MKRLPVVEALIAQANEENIKRNLFHLAKDPLPYRKANYTRDGQTKSTLDETDDFIDQHLRQWGYDVDYELVPIQAFRCDTSKHPSHWYSVPDPSDPWYTGNNLYAKKIGSAHPDQIIIVLAHKDSPSWIDSPGAHDNATGTCCNLEVTRLLADYASRKTIWFLYCNEEHWPWTSVTTANRAKERGDNLIAVFNLDASGGKSPADRAANLLVSSAVYGTPEGERLADLLAEVNQVYGLGLRHTKHLREQPANDDGSFVKAGFPAAIGVHGSYPWDDPAYHRPEDIAENVDPHNLCLVVQQIVAAVITLDQE